MKILKILAIALATACVGGFSPLAAAHGERAQMPQVRMRTVHWFDVTVSATKLDVNQILVVKGSFIPSDFWPTQFPSAEETAFLNIGVPGPSFVRLDSRVNGVPMIRSTSFHPELQYNFEITLKARKPGRYHIHPVINVKDTGPLIGPGLWVEIGGDQAAFTNTAKTLLGQDIDLESFGYANAVHWSILWAVVGVAWFVWWLLRVPIILPRFRRAAELGANADQMITLGDRRVALGFLVLTLSLIVGGYMYADDKWPITTALQAGKIAAPPAQRPAVPLDVRMNEARYRIPGRSFRVALTVTNRGSSPVTVGELDAGNVRFVNSSVLQVKPADADDLVASDALHVDGGPVAPGETRDIVVYADDALWETERMTTMIDSPDAIVAVMLFFYDGDGKRYPVEVGGPMIPVFG
ncbi:MAG: methane monooxygenase/ammonia monooxygenase subunit B [Nevskia sp.]|nr:methane monooxygenase/ammonia monooxygenase subunit B [Nevskia sp.]